MIISANIRFSDICSVVFTRIERIVVTSRPWEVQYYREKS